MVASSDLKISYPTQAAIRRIKMIKAHWTWTCDISVRFPTEVGTAEKVKTVAWKALRETWSMSVLSFSRKLRAFSQAERWLAPRYNLVKELIQPICLTGVREGNQCVPGHTVSSKQI